MRNLLLCDNANLASVTALATKNNLGIEFQTFYDPAAFVRVDDEAAKYRKLVSKLPLCAMHGPFADLYPGGMDPLVREVARKRFEQAVEIAGKLNVSHVILHHGYIPGTSLPQKWIELNRDFWCEFLDNKPEGLRIHLENLFETDPQFMAEVLAAIDDPRVDICLDLGHINCHAGGRALEWLRVLGDKIGWVHLHNNDGISDQHAGLEEGTLPMHEVCAALNEHAPDAVWALECRLERMPRAIEWLREYGFLPPA
ncbi:MAG: sugar phosphate isomerase/epimerase [candidate division Zixibacteria bacterium]|nr:sugar phosphate isomerase/epimerase [candidate division Zixibacteria bacterium]